MVVLGVILARAGSKGLPDKCLRKLSGKPVIAHTFDHAKAARRLKHLVFSTDSESAKQLAREAGIEVVDRPAELGTDTATVDAAARHAVQTFEKRHGLTVNVIVLLYGNIPIRADGLIDRAVEHLLQCGADSVRSVAPVTKQHPDWIHRLDGDRMVQFRSNSIYRRQDLEPLYYHDGAVVTVTRVALFGALDTPDDHQAFLGHDRRALVQRADEAVDIDEPIDLYLAEAVLRSRSNAIAPIRIDGCTLGPGQGVFVIAEAGVNHNGCVDTALRMVDVAAEAGADAVKFQIFRAKELVTADSPTAGYQRKGSGATSQQAMLAKLELALDDFARIKERCQKRSIVFLATPFTPHDVRSLCDLDVAAIKIASTDLNNFPLLSAAARTDLPLIVSTGAAAAAEIQTAFHELREWGAAGRLILLHCVSAYPTPIEALNLRAISSLESTYGVPCGLSDHTLSTQSGGWAVSRGACVLEKHFTLDSRQTGPDHAMSLPPEQLIEYIRSVRAAESALGDGTVGMTELQAEVRRVAGKSVVAAEDIPPGTLLAACMLTVKRPSGGITPVDLPKLVGKRTSVSVPADTALSWDMLC